MTTFLEFYEKVYRALGEESGTGPSELLVADGLVAAQVSILERVGKRKTTTLTGDGTTKEFSLPTDCYEIQGIRESDETGKLIPSAILTPGAYFGDYPEEQNFLEYPEGSVTFGKAPDSGDTLTVYYTAYFDEPTIAAGDVADDFVLEVPKKVERAVLFFACAYCLLPDAANASGLRQFNTRIDSGNPEHNPVEETVEFFFKLYDMELQKLPLITGGNTIG